VVFRVVRDCGAGVVLEQRIGNNWQGVVPNRASPPIENERGVQGTGVFYGQLEGEFRLRCLPGTGEGCEIQSVVTQVPRGSTTGIIDERVESACGKTAFIAKFNSLRIDEYVAELTVESDCGDGVKVERFFHQARGVSFDNAAETVEATEFKVGRGRSARWRVKSSENNGNVWFHITCLPGPNAGPCKFKIVVRDPTT
jgi:hypothetical protein